MAPPRTLSINAVASNPSKAPPATAATLAPNSSRAKGDKRPHRPDQCSATIAFQISWVPWPEHKVRHCLPLHSDAVVWRASPMLHRPKATNSCQHRPRRFHQQSSSSVMIDGARGDWTSACSATGSIASCPARPVIGSMAPQAAGNKQLLTQQVHQVGCTPNKK